MKFHKLRAFKEEPGVIGKQAVWVCYCEGYLYLGDTLLGLIKEMVTGWRKGRNLVG